MPYMVDVHSLLGKDVDASYNHLKEAEEASGRGSSSSGGVDTGRISYTLESMTPDLVQTGSSPSNHIISYPTLS